MLGDLSRVYRASLHLMETVRDTLPGAVLVGDSAQPVYAGCIYYPSAAPRSWFCSATGYGTLGYALPAAIGAQLAAAEPGRKPRHQRRPSARPPTASTGTR